MYNSRTFGKYLRTKVYLNNKNTKIRFRFTSVDIYNIMRSVKIDYNHRNLLLKHRTLVFDRNRFFLYKEMINFRV